VIAAANGLACGGRGSYDWRRVPGWFAFVLDSTWNLIGVTAALLVRVFSLRAGDPELLASLSRRQNRNVFRFGWSPRARFAFTVGNTITNAHDVEDRERLSLVERHEGLHVWQQRWFGPIFPLVYGLWMLGGAITGSVVWLVLRARHVGQSWFVVVERHAYYYNPFEHWAYAADDDWPPARMTRLKRPQQASG
jgi:hypothetical protein